MEATASNSALIMPTASTHTDLPACETCGSRVWYYGHQTTVFYEVTRLAPTPDGEDGELVAVVDLTTEEETDCAWRDVQCSNGHSLDTWDRSIDTDDSGAQVNS